jgi:zinc D-Ala-D-Ala carboxypeptidase
VIRGKAVFLPHRARPLALALLFAAASLTGGLPVMPALHAEAAELPACRYDDALTRYTQYSDWNRTLLDTIYRIPRSYVPPGLSSTRNAGIGGSGSVRRLLMADLRAMAAAARSANAGIRVISAYRSYATQQSVYRREVERVGVQRARLGVARPGHSEHQLGTTIDFGSAKSSRDSWEYSDWAQTRAGAWMKQNAWRFGFVMSYPKNKRGATCYQYEPWHYRYVGREMAAQVRASGLTLREYLWRQFH